MIMKKRVSLARISLFSEYKLTVSGTNIGNVLIGLIFLSNVQVMNK